MHWIKSHTTCYFFLMEYWCLTNVYYCLWITCNILTSHIFLLIPSCFCERDPIDCAHAYVFINNCRFSFNFLLVNWEWLIFLRTKKRSINQLLCDSSCIFLAMLWCIVFFHPSHCVFFFFYLVMKVHGYNSYEDISWNRSWNIHVGMSITVACIN